MRVASMGRAGLLAGLIGAAAGLTPAAAEINELRVAIQPGLTYLPFTLMDHDKLIEKHAREAGLGNVKVIWFKVAGGDVMNDGLISGNLEIAASGSPPFLTLWAKTRSSLDIRGVAAYNTLPLTLVTRNPDVRSVKNFSDTDRIALPAVKASTQAIILQMAAEQIFGAGQHNRFDHLTISRSHPDAMAALLSGRGTTPQNLVKMAQFMNRIGSIGAAPQTWKDLFFPNIHHLPGS